MKIDFHDSITKFLHDESSLNGILASPLRQAKEFISFSGQNIVCVSTGSGLKDPDTALSIEADKIEVSADIKEIANKLNWQYE